MGLFPREIPCHDCERFILRPCQPTLICADFVLILISNSIPVMGMVQSTCNILKSFEDVDGESPGDVSFNSVE
jgi:hypothetical protein